MAVTLLAAQGSGVNIRNANNVTITGTPEFNISSTAGIVFGASGGGAQTSGNLIFNAPVNLGGTLSISQIDTEDTAGTVVFNSTFRTGNTPTATRQITLANAFDGAVRFGPSFGYSTSGEGIRLVVATNASAGEGRAVEFAGNTTLESVQLNRSSVADGVTTLRALNAEQTFSANRTLGAILINTTNVDRVAFDGSQTLNVLGAASTRNIIATASGIVLPEFSIVQSGSGAVNLSGKIVAAAAGDVRMNKVTLTGNGAGALNIGGIVAANENVAIEVNRAVGTVSRLTGEFSTPHDSSGTTTVTSGTLLVNMTTTGNGAYSVAANGTLGGTGNLRTNNASVTLANGATLSAGDSSASNFTMTLGTGVLNLAAMDTAGRLAFTLGTTSDRITLATGSLNIGTLNSSEFAFTQGTGFGVGSYTLFDTTSSITGTLDTAQFNIDANFYGQLAYADGTNDIILNVAAVPEPSSLVLLSLGAAAFVAMRRRRQA